MHWETDLVHHIIEFRLQRLNDVGRNEQMRFVQILNDEFATQTERFVQVQQELLHSRITGVGNWRFFL